MSKSLLLTALVLASVSTSTLAQTAQRSGTPQEQQACAKDVSRHCRALMNQGDLVILSCLQQNRAKISPACDKVLKDHGQ